MRVHIHNIEAPRTPSLGEGDGTNAAFMLPEHEDSAQGKTTRTHHDRTTDVARQHDTMIVKFLSWVSALWTE